VPHFGCLLNRVQFDQIQERLERAKIDFIVRPYIRYEGLVGEQKTMFVLDFSGNPLEFKSYSREEELFL
jgi:extradiol dioxygenase family protein